MNAEKEIEFWRKVTTLPQKQFYSPYIKQSKYSGLSERGFGHGTCNIIVDNRDVSEYVLQSLKNISILFK